MIHGKRLSIITINEVILDQQSTTYDEGLFPNLVTNQEEEVKLFPHHHINEVNKLRIELMNTLIKPQKSAFEQFLFLFFWNKKSQ